MCKPRVLPSIECAVCGVLRGVVWSVPSVRITELVLCSGGSVSSLFARWFHLVSFSSGYSCRVAEISC